MQAQRLTGAGLIDHERRDTASRQPPRQTHAVQHLLRAIQAIDLHQDRCRPTAVFSLDEPTGEMRVGIGDFDALRIRMGKCKTASESVQNLAIELRAPRRAVSLHAFGSQVVGTGAPQLLARGQQVPSRFVLGRQFTQPLAHAHPRLPEFGGAGVVALFRHFNERRTHGLDLADASAHLDGEIDRQIPDVIGGEILEHVESLRGHYARS